MGRKEKLGGNVATIVLAGFIDFWLWGACACGKGSEELLERNQIERVIKCLWTGLAPAALRDWLMDLMDGYEVFNMKHFMQP